MRLFQTSNMGVDDVEVPPPFLRYPTMENIKNMSNYSVYRDHKTRLPTPEKMAIMDMSNSYERRRLGRQQQMLIDMNQRCREQEVQDLSSALTAKCDIKPLEIKKGQRELTFYATTYMQSKRQKAEDVPDAPDPTPNTLIASFSMKSPRGAMKSVRSVDSGYKHFPARRVIKHPNKMVYGDYNKTPRLNRSPTMINPDALTTSANNAAAVKMEMILRAKPNSSPIQSLHLPSIPNTGSSGRVESLSSSRVNLIGKRQKTMLRNGNSISSGKSMQSSFLNESSKSEQLVPLIRKITIMGESSVQSPPQPVSAPPEMMTSLNEDDMVTKEKEAIDCQPEPNSPKADEAGETTSAKVDADGDTPGETNNVQEG